MPGKTTCLSRPVPVLSPSARSASRLWATRCWHSSEEPVTCRRLVTWTQPAELEGFLGRRMAPGAGDLLPKTSIALILMGGWGRRILTPTQLKVRPRGKIRW